MNTTARLLLKKPEDSDPALIGDINDNSDILDNAARYNSNEGITGTWSFLNAGLTLKDTDASHVLTLKPGSNLSANRILTITTGDTDRTITLAGNPELRDWFNEGVKTTDWVHHGYLTVQNSIDASGTITGTRFISNIATGTSPVTVSSTTLNDNLNADMLDGLHSNDFTTAMPSGDLTAGSNKITIGGDYTGAVLGTGATVDVTEANITHNNIGGLTTGNPHTQYVNAVGDTPTIDMTLAGQSISGGIIHSAVNHDLLMSYSANKHIDHTSVSISTSTGLTGGGDISSTRTLSLSHLGIEGMTDPNADRLMFWDDSETKTDWLTLGTGLSITGATITNTGVTSMPPIIAMASGGTSKALTPSNGGIVYSDSDSMEILAGSSLASGFLSNQGVGNIPMWSQIDHNTALQNLTVGNPHTQYVNAVGDTPTLDLTLAGQTISGGIIQGAINHDLILGAHNLTTNIDHNTITNTHNLTTDIDHASITNTHNLTTDIDHDALTNYSANRHIDHTGVSILAGTGISGGGDISSSRTITNTDTGSVAVSGHTSTYDHTQLHVPVTVGDSTSIDLTLVGQLVSGVVIPGGIDHNSLLNYGANQHIDHTGVSITAGIGISGGGDISSNRTITNTDLGTVAVSGHEVTYNHPSFAISGILSHSTLLGLSSNDHTQYVNAIGDTDSINMVLDGQLISGVVIPGGVDHNSLLNYSTNRHIDHTTVSIINGNGITGGGDLSASRTIALTTLTSDWDIGDGRMIQTDKIIARSASGLALYDDGSNGIFVQDGGHIGINTTTPSATVSIYDPAKTANAITINAEGNYPGFRFYTANDTIYYPTLQGYSYGGTLAVPTATPAGRTLSAFIFGGYDTASVQGAQIRAVAENLWSSGHHETKLVFSTADTGYMLERLTILSGGNVGIGADPLAKLDINGAIICRGTDSVPVSGAGASLEVFYYTGGGGPYGVIFAFNRNDSTYKPLRIVGSEIGFEEGATRVMTIDGGNVGIGTTLADPKVEIHDTTGITTFTGDQTQGLRITGGDYTNSQHSLLGFACSEAGVTGKNLAQIGAKFTSTGSELHFGTSDNYGTGITNDALVINKDGNVGIGTIIPSAKVAINGGLHVGGDSDPGDNNLLVDGTLQVNSGMTLGGASTNTITLTGRAIFRTAASDPQHATPASRPAGNVGEIVYYAGKMYFCTNAATPTWEKFTST